MFSCRLSNNTAHRPHGNVLGPNSDFGSKFRDGYKTVIGCGNEALPSTGQGSDCGWGGGGWLRVIPAAGSLFAHLRPDWFSFTSDKLQLNGLFCSNERFLEK